MAATSSSQQGVWWFDIDGDRLLFKKDFPDMFLVHHVNAGKEKKTLDLIFKEEEAEYYQRTTVQVLSFKAVNPVFKELSGIKKRSTFLAQLQTIVEEKQLTLDSDDNIEDDNIAEQPPSPPKKKAKYQHRQSFYEEAVMMRQLHPQRDSPTFLATNKQQWKKMCIAELGYDSKKMGPFSCNFREQIFVASLPEACFDMVTELDQTFRDGKIRSSIAKTKMTSGTFQSLVGFHDEVRLLDVLTRLNDGEISIAELRQLGKEMQGEQKQEISERDHELIRLRIENARLQRENNRLAEMLNFQQEKDTHDKSTSTEATYAVGERVEAFWSADNSWYRAVIRKVTNNGYTVKFTVDRIVSEVKEDSVRPCT